MKKHIAYISMGSNLGDRIRNIEQGAADLEKVARIVKMSAYYQTSPVDYEDQGWFVNAAAKIETDLEAPALMEELKAIERRAGRERGGVRYGPRTLDLDIIFYDDAVIEYNGLVVPHPRMHKRCFVLRPLCDIDPGVIHPVMNRSVRDLLILADDDTQKVVPYR